MTEEEKGGVPDALKDAIAENLKSYMRRELYDPEDPDDIKRLAKESGVHERTIERLLRRSTYPDNQPALKSLAKLAAALRVETHHLVYIPKVQGGTNLTVTKATNFAKRNKAERR
jgi:ABC-type taurine transport system substrate-binding protein